MIYRKRIIDEEITKQLRISGAVLVKGPKRCGKTTSCKQQAKSFIELQDEDYSSSGETANSNILSLSKLNPSLLLEGNKPRLIDEWQLAPGIWNTIRHSIDESDELGLYLLTGSATPNDNIKQYLHSGVGRFSILNMKTMSLYESGDSNGKISLRDIVDGKRDIEGINDISYERMAFLICRGGWPSIFKLKNEEDMLEVPFNYIDTLCNNDISKIDGVKRNPQTARFILKSYSRLASSIDSDQTLIADVMANDTSISEKTIRRYLEIFKRMYIFSEIPAWSPNIRSATTIRSSEKKSLIDPSLAAAALEFSPKELAMDVNTYGLLFENLVDRDLSIYLNSIGGYLNHYRDRFGLECDQVAHFRNGKYALIETKIGSQEGINQAEKHLLKLKSLIEKNSRIRNPDFLMIITNSKYAYTTENGILVVPIGCLKN